MADSKIVNYIRDTISQGYKKEEIKSALLKQGWFPEEIEEAFRAVQPAPGPKSPEPKPEQSKLTVKKFKKPTVAGKHPQPKPEAHKKRMGGIKGGFILSVVGGILIMVNSLLVYLQAGDMLTLFVSNASLSLISMLDVALSEFDSFLINTIIGVFVTATSYIIHTMHEKSRITGLFIIALSLISVLIGNGFLIGGIVAIMGGILAVLGR
jgi:hypothetical protein